MLKEVIGNKFGWKIVKVSGKCLKKFIGKLAYREMLFYKKRPGFRSI